MKEKLKIHKLMNTKNKIMDKEMKKLNNILDLKESDKSNSKKNISLKKQNNNKLEPIKVKLTPLNKRNISKEKKNRIQGVKTLTENNIGFNKTLYLSPTHMPKTEKDIASAQGKYKKKNNTDNRYDIKEKKVYRNCTTPYRRILNNKYGEELSHSTSVIIKNFNYNNVYNFNIDNERIKNKKIHFSNKSINKNNNEDNTYNESYSNNCTSKFTYNKPKTSTGMATLCVSTKNKNSSTFFSGFITEKNKLERKNDYLNDDITFNVPKLKLNHNRFFSQTQSINNDNFKIKNKKSNINEYNSSFEKFTKNIKSIPNKDNTYISSKNNNSFSNISLKAKSINKFYKNSALSLKYNKNNNLNSLKTYTNFTIKTDISNNDYNKDTIESEMEIGFKLNDLFIFEDRINDIVSAFNNRNNIYDIEASNECNEFINFYSKSSLKGVFSSFFKENNKLIIESSINLSLFFILIIHHMSINNFLFNEIISTINNILPLLKLNFALYIKQIQLFHGSNIIKKNYTYFQPFNAFLNNNDIKEIETEEDITYKIYQNCRLITNEIKVILNYYQKINNNYYDSFIKIFNNISIQKENDLINYFYKGFKNENTSFNLITVNKNLNNIKLGGINNSFSEIKKRFLMPKEEKYLPSKNFLENIYIKTPKKIINSKFSSLKKIEKKTKIEIPYIKEPSNKKYSLVLNLNKTLAFYNKGKITLRTGLFSFLSMMKQYYELISFSSEPNDITKSILKEIESKEKVFDYNFGREHCILYENTLVKDISLIGRDLTNIIIVDDNENSFKLNEENGIKISKFEGYEGNIKIDNALFELKKILLLIYKVNYNDLRIALKDFENEINNKININ